MWFKGAELAVGRTSSSRDSPRQRSTFRLQHLISRIFQSRLLAKRRGRRVDRLTSGQTMRPAEWQQADQARVRTHSRQETVQGR